MGVAHVGLVHRDPCEYKVKGFCAVSFIERNVSKRRHLQGVRQVVQRAYGGRGHAGDGFPLREWEPFAGSVAPVAEGVQTDVDATMEALRQ